MLLARAYLMTGETRLARESLDRALSLKPSLMEAQVMLAGLDASVGHIKEARERLDTLIARDPGNVALLGMMFQLQTQEKDWGQSQATLTKLRTAGADRAAADLAEGHVAVEQQQWEKAEAAYVRAAEQRPMAPEPLLALVQLGMKRGQVAEAQSRLEGVLAAHPGPSLCGRLPRGIIADAGRRVGSNPAFRNRGTSQSEVEYSLGPSGEIPLYREADG
mgnify:CR=1 FL=1